MRFATTVSDEDMLEIIIRTNKSLMVLADNLRKVPESTAVKDVLRREAEFILKTTKLITEAQERQAIVEDGANQSDELSSVVYPKVGDR